MLIGLASKPQAYTWRQVAGAAALGGVGFTMSLFIAAHSFTGEDFSAAKIAIFLASLAAGTLGLAVLWRRAPLEATSAGVEDETAYATPVVVGGALTS